MGAHSRVTAGAPAPIKEKAAGFFQKKGKRERGTHFTRRARGKHSIKRESSRSRSTLVAVVLITAGLAAILYPYASDYLSRMSQAKVAQTQDQVVEQAPSEDLSAELAACQAFNQRIYQGRVAITDPFDPSNTTPTDKEYLARLNLAADDVMGELIIPKIDVDLPIYHGVTGDGMQHGVGHMPTTSLPIGGPSTHAVLAGHTGLPGARIFEDLDQLEEGDWFIVRALGEDRAYQVTSIEVVLPEETSSLAIQDGRDLVTLVTCTPYGINSHRLLVHAQRCEVPVEWGNADSGNNVPLLPRAGHLSLVILSLIGGGLGAGLALSWLIAHRHKRNHDDT